MWDALEPGNVDFAIRIGLAMLLGALIGFEREVDGHAAGFRTHMAVAIGACLFGIISTDGFDRFFTERADSNFQVDVTRVASGVVAAVGFLGAGAIVKNGASVRGLTTAASIWVEAAVGLAVGIGLLAPAIMATVALGFALYVLKHPRRWLDQWVASRRRTLQLQLDEGYDVGALLQQLHSIDGVTVRAVAVRKVDDGHVLTAELEATDAALLDEALTAIDDAGGVGGVELS